MEWLTLWLKKIILLVLLAAFLDLVLPNTNLQRYVKMVMGLLILMTIMSPVFSFLHVSQEDLALQIGRYQQEIVGKSSKSEWKAIADKLVGENNDQVTAYVTGQMENLIKTEIEKTYQVTVDAVRIQLASDAKDQPRIRSISIDIDNQTQPSAAKAVQIKPIEVKIKGKAPPDEAMPVSGSQDDPLTRQIATSVAKDWDLQPAQVHVTHNDMQENRQ